ncbi:MAG: hypothetical protein CSA23_03420 [Deltaproteobacteria bacterium]|nr:MAG: hypothetical protein CSA23_03420 [Deltaproteobacteria bacterium]
MTLEDFLALIKKKKCTLSRQDRLAMLQVGTLLTSSQFKESIDPHTYKFIAAGLQKGTRSGTPFVRILCGSALYQISGDARYLERVAAFLLNRNETIAYDVGHLNAIAGLLFNAPEKNRNAIATAFTRAFQRDLFIQIVDKVRDLADNHGIDIEESGKVSDRVVILIQQLLKPPHAPTRDALEFARILSQDFDKAVMIVNTCEFNAIPNGAMVPPFNANVMGEYANIRSVNYAGRDISLFQPASAGFEDEDILACIRAINQYDPEMILTVGSRNVISELYASSRFTFMYPTAAGLPLTTANYFHTWDQATEPMLRQADAEDIRDKYLFEQHPGFKTPEKIKQVSRSDLNLPASAFVFAVAGMRLHHVVDDAFLEMIGKIVEASPNAHILFVGHFDAYERIVDNSSRLYDRCTFAGFHDDIMSVYDICDAYINPKQPGGGSAIVYAMAAGLPALSLSFGDGGLAVKDLPEIKNYGDLSDVAIRLCEDKALYAQYKQRTKRIAASLSSRGPLVDRIMDAFNAYRSGQLRSDIPLRQFGENG